MANKRLIDANALLEAIDKSDKDNFHNGVANRSCHHYEHIHFMKMVLTAPTVDAVEVVLCKDCKHRDDGMCLMEEEYHYPWHKVEDDDFCSRGESKHIPNGDCT